LASPSPLSTGFQSPAQLWQKSRSRKDMVEILLPDSACFISSILPRRARSQP
jgi:hypothetical protein